MTKKEIIEKFGFSRKTLNNWENDKTNPRYLLYRTLESLPSEYVINIKRQIEEKEEISRLLQQ